MKRIFKLHEISNGLLAAASTKKWTAVIPAAGQGTRLNSCQPKILYGINRKPILYWLIDLLHPLVEKFVFILSPHAEKEVCKHLGFYPTVRFDIAIQNTPKGMADAVLCSENKIKTEHILIIWGDQITIKPQTLRACIYIHETFPQASITLPTIMKENPYIHFERGADDKIIRVYQKREEEIPSIRGENDCGVFCCNTKDLFPALKEAYDDACFWGKQTKEFNFLPIIPRLEQENKYVLTVQIDDLEETIGINDPNEARIVGDILQRRLNSER